MSVDLEGGLVPVVDDDSDVLLALGDLLEDAGHVVGTGTDGMGAVEGLQPRGHELMLTDLSMPRLGGHDLIERTARLYPHMVFVAMTAAPSQDAMGTSLDEEVRSSLTKPFSSLDVVLEKLAAAPYARRLRARISGNRTYAQRLLDDSGDESQ